MIILGIETATEVCAAAVAKDGLIVYEKSLRSPHIHSEKLLTLIDLVLKCVPDYDVVAVSIGPGSFTGLRIGLSAAKGLAYAADKLLVAVPTLEALAFQAMTAGLVETNGLVLSLIDARRNDAYAACFRAEGDTLHQVWSERAISLDSLDDLLPSGEPITVMGDGATKLERYLSMHDRKNAFRFPPEELRLCSAGSVALRGKQLAIEGKFADVSSLEPLYVKEFQTLVATQHK